MALEQHDGLEFPFWLWALPGAVVLKTVAGSAPAPAASSVVVEPLQTPLPGPALPPVGAPQAAPSYEPSLEPAPEPTPPQAQRRVSEAIRAAAHASAVSQATQRVSAAIETRAQKQVSAASHPAELQVLAKNATAAFKQAVEPNRIARETVRIEKKLQAEVETLKRAGMSASNIEALAKRKTGALLKKAEREVKKATAPLRDAVQHVPAPFRRDAERAVKAVTAPVRREIERQAKQAVAPIKRESSKLVEPVLTAVRQEATKIGRQLGVGEASKLFTDFGKKMGIPNLPWTPPTDLSLNGVRDAAYNTGKKFIQDRFSQATGLPLPMPPTVSVKAIKKWADDLVPDDARQAIEMGIDAGLTATTSAVSALLTGAIGGSIVPGLGTVIGIGVALGVAALKGVVKESITEKHAAQQLCKADDKLYKQYMRQVSNLPKLSPLQLVPWVAQKSFDASKAVAEEQHKTKCGRTPYMTTLRQIGKNVFEPAKATVPVLGLQQLDQLIEVYARAPKQEFFWDKGTIQPGGRIVGGTGKVLFGPSAAGHDVSIILKLMQTRRAQLQTFVAQASRVESLPPNAIAPLRFNLVTEIRNATMMYQLDPQKSTEAWLKMLMGFLARLVRTEAAAVGTMRSTYEQDLRREAELRKQGKTGVVTGII